jgi:hypothetical protein
VLSSHREYLLQDHHPSQFFENATGFTLNNPTFGDVGFVQCPRTRRTGGLPSLAFDSHGRKLTITMKDWVDFTTNHFLTPFTVLQLASLQPLLHLSYNMRESQPGSNVCGEVGRIFMRHVLCLQTIWNRQSVEIIPNYRLSTCL